MSKLCMKGVGDFEGNCKHMVAYLLHQAPPSAAILRLRRIFLHLWHLGCSKMRPMCLHFAPQAQKSREEWIFAPMMLPFCAPGHVFFNLLPTFGPLLAYSSTLSLLLVFLLLQLLQIPTTTKKKNKKGLKAIENPRN